MLYFPRSTQEPHVNKAQNQKRGLVIAHSLQHYFGFLSEIFISHIIYVYVYWTFLSDSHRLPDTACVTRH